MIMQIFGRNINPKTALNRYGQIIKDVSNPEIPYARKSPADYYGNADRSFAYLASQPGIGRALEFTVDHPGMVAAGLAGGTVVNNLVGNPVGGGIDFLSMGLTNLKPDEYIPSTPQQIVSKEVVTVNPIISQQPGMVQQPSQVQIPELNEEERAKFMKYTTNRTAQQVLTYQALQDFLGQQPGMEGYQ